MRITRAADAPPYSPPLHQGVDARRLQGMEAGPTERFWVGLSVYSPDGAANTAPTVAETVYVVLSGSLRLETGDVVEDLYEGDSVHLPKGTVRSVRNVSGAPARLLVVIGTPS